MKQIILLLIAVIFTSCDSLQSAYFKANTQRTFASSQAYIETVAKDSGLESSRIIILEDEAYKGIAADVVNDGLSTYYGIVYKSEIVSANELNIKSCQGQIIELYRSIPDASGRFSKVSISSLEYLQGLHFDPEKKTVIILYSYKLGSLTKAKIVPVISELKNDPDYYIISLDNPDIFK